MRLGKFEGCENQELGARLCELALDGCAEIEGGDVDGPLGAWYAVVEDSGRWYVVEEDSQGFFDYREFADKESALALFESLSRAEEED
jgi:hypothetical protein